MQLYSRISHQKYLMYAECSKRVAGKRMQNPSKDTTLILNELLADEVWLSQVCFVFGIFKLVHLLSKSGYMYIIMGLPSERDCSAETAVPKHFSSRQALVKYLTWANCYQIFFIFVFFSTYINMLVSSFITIILI